LVATCLVKDPRKRPPSEKLLKHSFFKHARSAEYLARGILDGLPPLGERFRELKSKEAELLLNNKLGQESKEQLSQVRVCSCVISACLTGFFLVCLMFFLP